MTYSWPERLSAHYPLDSSSQAASALSSRDGSVWRHTPFLSAFERHEVDVFQNLPMTRVRLRRSRSRMGQELSPLPCAVHGPPSSEIRSEGMPSQWFRTRSVPSDPWRWDVIRAPCFLWPERLEWRASASQVCQSCVICAQVSSGGGSLCYRIEHSQLGLRIWSYFQVPRYLGEGG